MKRALSCFLACLIFLFALSALADEVQAQNQPISSIPFKTSQTPFEEYGTRFTLAMVFLLIVYGCAIYLIRRKNPQFGKRIKKTSRINVVEYKKLNSRTSLYVVEFNQRQLLIGQSGDSLTCLSDASSDNHGQGLKDV